MRPSVRSSALAAAATRPRTLALAVAVVIVVTLLPVPGARAALGPADVRITRDGWAGSYLRYDGLSDPVLAACSNGRRNQIEPTLAVDPRDTDVIVAGGIDRCRSANSDLFTAWPGYYRSSDGGSSWQNSLVPGYPEDDSPAALASPARRFCDTTADPTLAFDRSGRVFYAFDCANTPGLPVSASIQLATYDDDGAHYLRTTSIARGTPSRAPNGAGIEYDKPNLAVDQTTGTGGGNVYLAWTRAVGNGTAERLAIMFARSTDHGATFGRPQPVAAAPLAAGRDGGIFTDLAVAPDGAVYLLWMSEWESGEPVKLLLARSTDRGRSWGRPSRVATIAPFDSIEFSGNGAIRCGILSPCPSGFTFPALASTAAVAADQAGVHIVWTAGRRDGQAKVSVINSAGGISFSEPEQLDTTPVGHQWFPDLVTADGSLTAVFYDSRRDPAYSPHRPPGNTAGGLNSGNGVDVYRAVSTDGGRSWSEDRLNAVSFNANWNAGPVPFMGDYLSASAVPGRAWAGWADARDIVPGIAPLFIPFLPCNPLSTPFDDPCFSQGGLDWNIYGRRLD